MTSGGSYQEEMYQLVHAASGDSLYGIKRIEKSQLFGD